LVQKCDFSGQRHITWLGQATVLLGLTRLGLGLGLGSARSGSARLGLGFQMPQLSDFLLPNYGDPLRLQTCSLHCKNQQICNGHGEQKFNLAAPSTGKKSSIWARSRLGSARFRLHSASQPAISARFGLVSSWCQLGSASQAAGSAWARARLSSVRLGSAPKRTCFSKLRESHI